MSNCQLIGPADPPVFEIHNRNGSAQLIIACDHASAAVPARLDRLGLDSGFFEQHIAYDLGAAAVARRVADLVDARAVLGGYSRLVVDLNRNLSDSSAVPALSDGILVPGNLGLSAGERQERVRALYGPYHEAVGKQLEEILGSRGGAVLVSIHSFTPTLHGIDRPWEMGVLWDADSRLALPLLELLRRDTGIRVGDNEPYSGRHPADYTIDVHGEANGLACAGVEIRQDLIVREQGQERFAQILAGAIKSCLAEPDIFAPVQSLPGSCG